MLITVRGRIVSAIDLVIWHFWVLFNTTGYHVLKEVGPVFENCVVFFPTVPTNQTQNVPDVFTCIATWFCCTQKGMLQF